MAKQSPEFKLVLVDGHALIFRAFYGLPPMNSPSGEHTNAVYGFTRILLNVLDELEPTCLAIAFDSPGDTFRNEVYEEYKANRTEPPSELISQIPLTQKVVEAFSIPQFALVGWEADDIIATLASQAVDPQIQPLADEVTVVTGDLDLLQLVDDQNQVNVFVPGMRGKQSVLYREDQVIDKLGITQKLVPDYKGLAGDASDNIPGIRGIGPKTAVKLLTEFGSLEGVYQAIESGKTENIGKSVLDKLVAGQEIAFLSRQLATVSREVPVSLDLDLCQINQYDKTKVTTLFQELGFKSLLPRLPDDEFEAGVQEALF